MSSSIFFPPSYQLNWLDLEGARTDYYDFEKPKRGTNPSASANGTVEAMGGKGVVADDGTVWPAP